jgi:hypothetical protein
MYGMEKPITRLRDPVTPLAMRYDDRLATVLRLTPVGPNVARIQFRQLLDLLGTRPADDQGEMLDQAYLRLGELSARLPMVDRLAILRQPGLRLRAPRLVSMLAQGEPAVGHAAIQAAQLGDDQWLDLIPALPLAARGLLRDRHDLGASAQALLLRLGVGDRALPGVELHAPAAVTPPVAAISPRVAEMRANVHPMLRADEDIGALVRRIEAFRRARENGATASPETPRLPLGEDASGQRIECFDFASDGEGRIVWSESMVAPMVVGHLLGGHGHVDGAVRLHQPLRALPVTLAGAPAIAGEWQVDAVPRFDPLGGRFIGHLGRFRRPSPASESATAPATVTVDSEADRLRQLLHELRTPVNAIQGFAEIIQQQLFGPAPHEYRALAAVITADSARMLAGFEELDRFAKLDSGAMDIAPGECDLGECLATTVARLLPTEGAAGAHFRFAGPSHPLPVALAAIEAERLCWRLLATLAGNAGADEVLPVTLTLAGTEAMVRLALPKSLAALDEGALYHAAASPSEFAPSAGMFGTGFALRLAGVEVQAAGGQLIRDGETLVLHLPGLTQTTGDYSKYASDQSA